MKYQKPLKNKKLILPQKRPLKIQDPHLFDDSFFCWRASSKYLDYPDKEWGWKDLKVDQFFSTCLGFLQHYESKTWATMNNEQHCHPVDLDEIDVRAKNRIKKLYPDMEGVYQVKAQGRCRIFGHKEGKTFFLIWHDPKHTVYPSGK